MKTLLIDSSSIIYKYALTSSNYELTTSDGTVVTCVYSFLNDLLELCTHFSTNKVVVAFDSVASIRKSMSPTYKVNRKEVPEDIKERRKLMYAQVPIIKEFLTSANFICREIYGFEADDIIASYVQNNPEEQFITVSGDHDMWQTICSNNMIYNPNKKEVFNTKDFQELFPKLDPKEYWKILSIAGCTTDHVEGVKGVGEKTAYKYLVKELKPTSKAFNTIKENKAIIYETQKLVKLPHTACPECKLEYTTLNQQCFFETCNKYGFNSFLTEDFMRWRYVFNLYG